MANHTLRWGIIGPGGIAKKFTEDLKVSGTGVVEAVVSRDLGRARQFAGEYGAPLAFDSVEELAACQEIECVYIAVPHVAHEEAAVCLLEQGKPILVEKPLTVNATQAARLIEISRKRGVFLMEAMWTRCLPIYAKIKEWISSGAIGDVRMVTSNFCFRGPKDPNSRWLNPALAGGALLDLGVYNLAMTQMFAGQEPDRIAALASFASTGVDTGLVVSLSYPSSVLAHFACGFEGPADNALVITGSRGFIRVPSAFISAHSAEMSRWNEVEKAEAPLRGKGFEFEIEEVARCLAAGEIESPLMPHADTLATARTMDAIRRQIGLVYPFE